MRALEFKEQNIVFAENQEEYENLPAKVDGIGIATSCFELDDDELKRIKKAKKLWITRLTFGAVPQPMKISVEKPEFPVSVRDFVCTPMLHASVEDPTGEITYCFPLSKEEIQQLSETKTFWMSTATFKSALQPIKLLVASPE